MELMMNEQGSFELYDDTYDVVIHCDSEKARDEVLADLKAINDRLDVLDKIRAEIDQKQYDFMSDGDYDEGIRFGLMLAYQIIDKYKTESEEL